VDYPISRVNPKLHVVNESKNSCLEDGPDISVGLEFNGAPDSFNGALQAFPCGSRCPGKTERFDPGGSGIIFAGYAIWASWTGWQFAIGHAKRPLALHGFHMPPTAGARPTWSPSCNTVSRAARCPLTKINFFTSFSCTSYLESRFRIVDPSGSVFEVLLL
jgi:hypothetical protein